LILLSFI